MLGFPIYLKLECVRRGILLHVKVTFSLSSQIAFLIVFVWASCQFFLPCFFNFFFFFYKV